MPEKTKSRQLILDAQNATVETLKALVAWSHPRDAAAEPEIENAFELCELAGRDLHAMQRRVTANGVLSFGWLELQIGRVETAIQLLADIKSRFVASGMVPSEAAK